MEAIHMNIRAFVVPMVLVFSTAMGNPLPGTAEVKDGQAAAAALLSRPWAPVIPNAASSQQIGSDAHARAAALLSGSRTEQPSVLRTAVSQPSEPGRQDGQARAAGLLSRPRTI
jgi:hypothetical protein